MSQEFSTLPREEQVALAQSIAAVAVECELDGVKPEFYTEMVCSLVGKKMVEGKKLARVTKEFPSSKAEQVKLFNEKVKAVIGDIKGVAVDVSSKMGAGDMYQTIEDVMPIDKDEKCSIVHNKGDVILVDFWATWCPPCQKPMAHNQEMLEKRAADWGGKVRIIGVSIDKSKEAMKSHVEEKKWGTVEHYHRHESKCSATYGVQGVPHVMLIDTEGRMVFVGHPATRQNLEEDFDKLLKGEKLTGEGAWVEDAAPAEGEEAKPVEEALGEGFKSDCDTNAIHAQINAFEAQAKEWIESEEITGKTEGLKQGFCVMTLEEKLDSKTGQMAARFYNHRVLVGPQAKIDEMKTFMTENVKGDFEVKLREHPM